MLFAPLASWTASLTGSILLALFHSPRWGWASGAIVCAALSCRVLFLRWPWVPRRTIDVQGLRYPLAEARDWLKPADFFGLCMDPVREWDLDGPRAAARGSKSLLRGLLRHAQGEMSPDRRRAMFEILKKTSAFCASCGRAMPPSFQDLEWLSSGGDSFAVFTAEKTPLDACSACACADFYFLYSTRGTDGRTRNSA
jgi:hypothetical protein